jgi:hypothetical protein
MIGEGRIVIGEGGKSIFKEAYKGNLVYVKEYVAQGKNVNILDAYFSTPIFEAIKGNNIKIVSYLLSNGANINHKNKFGKSPLMYAFIYGRCDIAKLILDRKPDPDIFDKSGNTIGYYFRKGRCYQNIAEFQNEKALMAQAEKVKPVFPENKSAELSFRFPEQKIRVAILSFQAGSGISQPEAAYLTNRVRTAIIELNKFDVISNDQIQKMMEIKEMKQKIGDGSCSTKECIIDLGNALECEKMFVGSAEGAFGEYLISLKLVDVASQKYELAKDIRISDKKEFPSAAMLIVNKLFGRK